MDDSKFDPTFDFKYSLMKRSILKFSFLVFLIVITVSCKKDRWMNEEEAADIMARALEQNSGGLAREVDLQTTYWMLNLTLIPCGDSMAVVRNFQYSANGNTASADYVWNIRKHCTDSDVYLTWTSNFTGEYDFQRIKGTTEGQRNWTATQLSSVFTEWKLNGTGFRLGSHESKVRRRRSFNSKTETIFTDVLVNKNTRRLVGGTATSTILVETNSGNTFTYNVVTTISSQGVATVVVNGHKTFTFNLY